MREENKITEKTLYKELQGRKKGHLIPPPTTAMEDFADEDDEDDMTASVAEKPFTFLSLEKVLTLPPPEWLVEGLVPLGGVGILYGASGSYKSFFALHLAASCATGRDAFVSKRCKEADVFYIAAEGASGFRLRIGAWIKHHNKRPERLYVRPFSAYLDQENMVNELIAEMQRLADGSRPRFLIIDTLSTNFAGKENTDEMADFMRRCARIGKDANATVLIVHHTGKDERKQERGHYSLRANADFSLLMEGRDGKASLTVQKFKDAPLGAPLKLSLPSVDVALGTEFPSSLVVAQDLGFDDADDEHEHRTIFECAVDLGNGVTQGTLATKVNAIYRLSPSTITRWIKDAMPEGEAVEWKDWTFERSGKGKGQRIITITRKDDLLCRGGYV